jgi:hypothetical protein
LDQLPKEFVDVKGLSDAPLSAYERFCRIQETADAFIPAEVQRTMFAVMLSEMMSQPQQASRAHTECACPPVAADVAILRLRITGTVVGCARC